VIIEYQYKKNCIDTDNSIKFKCMSDRQIKKCIPQKSIFKLIEKMI
jgi:hypothetical protein